MEVFSRPPFKIAWARGLSGLISFFFIFLAYELYVTYIRNLYVSYIRNSKFYTSFNSLRIHYKHFQASYLSLRIVQSSPPKQASKSMNRYLLLVNVLYNLKIKIREKNDKSGESRKHAVRFVKTCKN